MVRNFIRRSEPAELPTLPPKAEVGEAQQEAQVQILEREITLTLLNEKLNYITALLHKLADAAEVDF